SQGARHPTAQVGGVVEDLAEAPPECPGARSTAAADRGGHEASGAGVRLRDDTLVVGGGGSHPPDVHLSLREREVAEGGASRWTLSAALEPGGRKSLGAVGMLYPPDADRGGFPNLEERVGAASDLSPSGEAGGSPYLRGLLGLCPFGDPQAATGRLSARPDASGGAGKTGHAADARCVLAHHRRTLADHAPLHPAGT